MQPATERSLMFAIAAALIAGCHAAPSPATGPSGPALGAEASPRAMPAPTTPAADTVTGHAADVRFVQGMMAHHAQAIVMAAMVPSRTSRDDMKLLAERITLSQQSEIDMMRRWLVEHHEEVPPDDAHFHMESGHMTPMPGMLTADELARLAKASGVEFDRLFLRDMIRHHEGALAMVAKLFGTTGAAQAPEIYRFASDVDADQRAEIARMQTLQREIR